MDQPILLSTFHILCYIFRYCLKVIYFYFNAVGQINFYWKYCISKCHHYMYVKVLIPPE